jgi:hypothetical protein
MAEREGLELDFVRRLFAEPYEIFIFLVEA